MRTVRTFLLFATVLTIQLISCQELKEPYEASVAADTSSSTKIKKSVIYFSGKPDLPQNDLQITTAGIGNSILGKSLNDLLVQFESAKSISVYEDGIAWPGVKLSFPDKTWLIAEAVNTVESITHIRTNNHLFETSKGYHAGMPVDSIFISGDTIKAYPEHKAFEFGNSNIWFKIDPANEKKVFKNNSLNFNLLKKAYIDQIFIICGDC